MSSIRENDEFREFQFRNERKIERTLSIKVKE